MASASIFGNFYWKGGGWTLTGRVDAHRGSGHSQGIEWKFTGGSGHPQFPTT